MGVPMKPDLKPDRRRLIRLAHANPALRPALMPLINEMQRTAASVVHIDIEERPRVGGFLTVASDGEPFTAATATEWHYIVATDSGVVGNLITKRDLFSPGDRLAVQGSHARIAGAGDTYAYAGPITVQKV